jgi:hypothetical protein
MKTIALSGAALLACFGVLAQELPKPELKKRLKDESHPAWIYDDLPAAFSAAKQTGKPILAVFRCVP